MVPDKKISRTWAVWVGLTAAILLALTMRLRGLAFGLPALLDPDEPIFVLIALKLLKGHTLNPGWFGHPGTITIYSLAVVEAGVFLIGQMSGRFADTHAFTVALYHDPGLVFLPGRVVMLLSALLTILLTYRLASQLFDRRVALASALLLAVDPIHIRYSQIIRTDMQATIFVILVLLAALRITQRGTLQSYAMAGLWLGIACATKWPAGTAAAGVLGAVAFRIRCDSGEWKDACRGIGVFALAAVASCIAVSPYLLLDFATVVSNLHGEARPIHLGATGSGLFGNMIWYLAHPLCTALGAGGLALTVAGLLMGPRRNPAFGYVIVTTVIAFYVSISAQHLVWERWVVPMLPLLTIAIAFVAVRLVEIVRQHRPALALPAMLALAVGIVLPTLDIANAQAAERATDTRRLASMWARRHIPSGSTVAIEYLAFDALSAPWSFLYPAGDRGCVDVRANLSAQVTVATVGTWRSTRSIVDFGGIEPRQTASCRADYLILANYDRYLAEPKQFSREIDNYRRIMQGGRTIAVFVPKAGVSGGPIVRIIALGQSAKIMDVPANMPDPMLR